MAGNPKHIGSQHEHFEIRTGKKPAKSSYPLHALFTNGHTLIPLLSGGIMVFSGLTIVCITILGLITPLWVSALLSLIGCISSMMGGFLIYYTITSQGSFDRLINQAIRRVINSQN